MCSGTEVDVSAIFDDFENHLQMINNDRVFFSGKFGSGKTYFLNDFFQEKEDDYEVFHLFPVNYQVSSNEDVVELMKYDVLMELLSKKEDILTDEDYEKLYSWQLMSYVWVATNHATIGEELFKTIPKIGKGLSSFCKLIKNFTNFKEKHSKTDGSSVTKFIEKIENLKEDVVAHVIRDKVKTLKDNKLSVLILDDLDRMDPAHIFRILNVFSAHSDSSVAHDKNKFGFDKVILVADKDNIKNIFHHVYGEDTDFNGYFDKFFSIEAYNFNVDVIISDEIERLINHFPVGSVEDKESFVAELKFFMQDILTRALYIDNKEKLTIRLLMKGVNFSMVGYKKVKWKNIKKSDAINVGIEVLIAIFGKGQDEFVSVLKRIKDQGDLNIDKDFSRYSPFINELALPFVDSDRVQGGLMQRVKIGGITFNYGVGEVQGIQYNRQAKKGQDPFTVFYNILIQYVESGIYKVG